MQKKYICLEKSLMDAATYSIPRSTISDQVTGKMDMEVTMGKIPCNVENKIIRESMVTYGKGLGSSEIS